MNRNSVILVGLIIIYSATILVTCDNPEEEVEPLNYTDIDGNVYSSVIIGEQEWMVENLLVTRYRNGDTISTGYIDVDWLDLTEGAYCAFGDDEANVEIYGRLYNGHAVLDPRNIAPRGWRVPTYENWEELMDYLDRDTALNALIDSGSIYWTEYHQGNNSSGFTALPSGIRADVYFALGTETIFWASTVATSSYTYGWHFNPSFRSTVHKWSWANWAGLSVRCIRD